MLFTAETTLGNFIISLIIFIPLFLFLPFPSLFSFLPRTPPPPLDSYYLDVGPPGTPLYLPSFLSYFPPFGFCFVFAFYSGKFSLPHLSTFVIYFSNPHFHF